MTEENTRYERRADHGKRAALMRLRLIEAKAIPVLEAIGVLAPLASDGLGVANELSAAIDGVVNYMRQTPPEGV